ncbi:MAG: anthranilate synthase component I family protein [Thermodesulfovibrionales bacterium]|nr:anthranilate synthase component I family protein [Thermodesulfovibrionales bacterium]
MIKLNIDKKEFLRRIKEGQIPTLYIEMPFNDPSHIYEIYCKDYLGDTKNSIILESLKGNFKIARYSFIASNPFMIIRLKNGFLQKTTDNYSLADDLNESKPVKFLKEIIFSYPQKPSKEIPPFQGGAIGAFSYDFVRYIEKIPNTAYDDLSLPDMHFLFVDMVISFDHLKQKAWIVSSPGAYRIIKLREKMENIDWESIYEETENNIALVYFAIKQKLSMQYLNKEEVLSASNIEPLINYEMSKRQYMDMVKRAKEYIAAGDIFQANLSQRISTLIGNTNTWRIYKILRKINPSPFAFYANLGDYHVVSSSPERLIRVMNNVIDTRPIAGTRPRGNNYSEDELMRKELLLNEKERAEHIMLIDLERNDIGRVSRYGTVEVDELMITEDYSHVIHIVSNIRGILQTGKTCLDVLRATFPGGTITGVPKVRCMEIIDELEPVKRGLYTGSFGYITFSGNMDMNIVIRTFTIKEGIAYVQAGAGIVADSDPEKEYYETLKKAEALIKTLKMI